MSGLTGGVGEMPLRRRGALDREVADPLEIGVDPQRRHDVARVDSQRVLTRNELQAAIIEIDLQRVDSPVSGDHLAQNQWLPIDKSSEGQPQSRFRERSHRHQPFDQLREVLSERLRVLADHAPCQIDSNARVGFGQCGLTRCRSSIATASRSVDASICTAVSRWRRGRNGLSRASTGRCATWHSARAIAWSSAFSPQISTTRVTSCSNSGSDMPSEAETSPWAPAGKCRQDTLVAACNNDVTSCRDPRLADAGVAINETVKHWRGGR